MALLAQREARADRDGFLEVVAGPTLVQGDDDYENLVDDSFKLGLRGGSMGKNAGLEVSLDWTALDDNVPLVEVDATRFRFLVGGRGGARIGKVLVFGRAAIGVDYVTVDWPDPLEDRSGAGLALELGAGALVNLGGFYLGGQLAIPMAFHSDDEEDGDVLALDYTSTEIDLLLTAGLTF